jgi:lysophospholipase-2
MPPTPPTPLRLRSHTVKPLGAHTHTIIFLHGRGSDATEFALELFESHASATKLNLRDSFPSFKWVFPSAPSSVPANKNATDGFAMSQWFDIWNVADPQMKRENQRDGLNRSVEALMYLVQKEIKEGGVSSEHIFLAGISQGIALAAHTLFRLNTPLAGLLGFCGWLPFEEEIRSIASADDWDGSLNDVRAILGSGQFRRTGEPQLETVAFLHMHETTGWCQSRMDEL